MVCVLSAGGVGEAYEEHHLWLRVRQAEYGVPSEAKPCVQVPCGGVPQLALSGQEQPGGGQGDEEVHCSEEKDVISTDYSK